MQPFHSSLSAGHCPVACSHPDHPSNATFSMVESADQTHSVDVVLLIHGTFSSPQTPFFTELRSALTTAFPSAQIESPPWSGGNNLESRYAAELQLLRSLRQKRGKRVLVIAHSHGGNIAYRALTRLSNRRSPIVLGLCTIGTPFIEMTAAERPMDDVTLVAGIAASAICVALALCSIPLLSLLITYCIVPLVVAARLSVTFSLWLVIAVYLAYFVWVLRVLHKSHSAGGAVERLVSRLAASWRDACLRLSDRWGPTAPLYARHLCVIGARDEAFAWLQFWLWIAFLAYAQFVLWVLVLVGGLVLAVCFGAACVTAQVALDVGSWLTVGQLSMGRLLAGFDRYALIAMATLTLLFFVSAAVSFVLGPWLLQTRLGFGAQTCGFYLWVRPDANQIPPNSVNMTARTVPASGVFQHNNYLRDPQLVEFIVSWCRDQARRDQSS